MVETSPKRRRRFLRISLRAMLLVMLATGPAIGWTMHKVREQPIAIAALEQMGCNVFDCYPDGPPGMIERLRMWLNEDQRRDLTVVIANGKPVDDASLVYFARLSQLRGLELEYTKVTSAGLKYLRGLTGLKYLKLKRTAVGDAGLVYLRGLTRLERLDLTGTQVTQAGVQELQRALPNCSIIASLSSALAESQ
jgi:hypothetical protein